MRYIITVNEDDRIMYISKTIGYETNGNIILDNNTQIACVDEVTIHEVENVPENVLAEKYCYTKEQGFYKNTDDKEPEKTDAEKIEELQQQVTDLQLAITEMYESGV